MRADHEMLYRNVQLRQSENVEVEYVVQSYDVESSNKQSVTNNSRDDRPDDLEVEKDFVNYFSDDAINKRLMKLNAGKPNERLIRNMQEIKFIKSSLSYERFHIDGVHFYVRSIDGEMVNVIYRDVGDQVNSSVTVPVTDVVPVEYNASI